MNTDFKQLGGITISHTLSHNMYRPSEGLSSVTKLALDDSTWRQVVLEIGLKVDDVVHNYGWFATRVLVDENKL